MNKYLKFLIVVLLDLSLVGLIFLTGQGSNDVFSNILTFVLIILNLLFTLAIFVYSKFLYETDDQKQKLVDSFNDRLKFSTYWSMLSTTVICLCLAGIGWIYWACTYFILFFLARSSLNTTVATFKKELED